MGQNTKNKQEVSLIYCFTTKQDEVNIGKFIVRAGMSQSLGAAPGLSSPSSEQSWS